MSWKLKSKPITRKVTRDLAKHFATMEAVPNDRPLSERRMAAYRLLFEQGQFRPCTWATATCTETGLTYRVNGKHTSTLLSTLEEIPEFFVTIEEYQCDALEDLGRLYSTFDSKTQSRSNREIYASFAGTMPQLSGVAHSVINLVVAGVGYHIWGEQYYGKPVADRAELILSHTDFALWLDSEMELASRKARHLLRSPVTAAMFATWQRDKASAQEFWMAVRDETGTMAELPDRKLARYLMLVGVDTGSGSRKKEKAGVREIYCRCLTAWNKWRRGETTDIKYFANAKLPDVD